MTKYIEQEEVDHLAGDSRVEFLNVYVRVAVSVAATIAIMVIVYS